MNYSKAKFKDYLLLIPGIGFILAIIIVVILYVLAQSFGLDTINGKSNFTLDNWKTFADKRFFDSLFYSLRVGIISSILSLAFCYPLSMLLQISPARNTMLSLMKVPMFIPMLVGCFLILNLVDYHGLVNFILQWLGITKEPIQMRNDNYAIGVIVLEIWKNVPMQMMIVFSALQGIRVDVKEAARNLGCKGFRMFGEIIFPLTIVNALVAVILTFISAFFDFSVSSTAGPNYPISLAYLLRNTAYTYQQWGRAACIGIVMIAAAIVIIALYSRLAKSVRKY
jgi:putative spermidine/putrescine transport system permease protein